MRPRPFLCLLYCSLSLAAFATSAAKSSFDTSMPFANLPKRTKPVDGSRLLLLALPYGQVQGSTKAWFSSVTSDMYFCNTTGDHFSNHRLRALPDSRADIHLKPAFFQKQQAGFQICSDKDRRVYAAMCIADLFASSFVSRRFIATRTPILPIASCHCVVHVGPRPRSPFSMDCIAGERQFSPFFAMRR